MQRATVVAAFVLSCGLLFPGRPAHAGWHEQGPWRVGGALSGGTSVFLPYLFALPEASAEVVVGDRLAIGSRAILAGFGTKDVSLMPFVAVGSPRSRASAAYGAIAWMPRTNLGTVGLGYEAALRGGFRLYGEAGVVWSIGEEGSVGLPYGHLGVRLRF